MENLWQQLKPAVKKQILADKERYPYIVNSIKEELVSKFWWTDLSVNTARQVISFTHDSILDVSYSDFMWGSKFLKATKDGE
jgi:hypothetical protein